jgi:hypothetical protein
LGAVADQAYARPKINGAADTVAALRDEDYALAFARLKFVDRRLNGLAVVLLTVAVDVELLRG